MKAMRRIFACVAACLAFAGALAPFATRAQTALEPLRLTSGPFVNAIFWDINVALAKGFFKQEGFEPEFVLTGGSPQAIQMFIGGTLDFAASQPETILAAHEKGGDDLVIISAPLDRPDWYLVARPEIKTWSDLKGKNVAVSALRVNEYWMTKQFIESHGLTAQDWGPIQVGLSPQKMAALDKGSVAAAPLLQPIALLAIKNGYTLLAKFSDIPVSYVPNVHVTSRKWASVNNRGIRLGRAIEHAHEWICDSKNRSEAVDLLGKHAKFDRDILEQTWDLFCTGHAPYKTAKVDLPGLERVVDMMVKEKSLRAPIAAKDFMLPKELGGLWR